MLGLVELGTWKILTPSLHSIRISQPVSSSRTASYLAPVSAPRPSRTQYIRPLHVEVRLRFKRRRRCREMESSCHLETKQYSSPGNACRFTDPFEHVECAISVVSLSLPNEPDWFRVGCRTHRVIKNTLYTRWELERTNTPSHRPRFYCKRWLELFTQTTISKRLRAVIRAYVGDIRTFPAIAYSRARSPETTSRLNYYTVCREMCTKYVIRLEQARVIRAEVQQASYKIRVSLVSASGAMKT